MVILDSDLTKRKWKTKQLDTMPDVAFSNECKGRQFTQLYAECKNDPIVEKASSYSERILETLWVTWEKDQYHNYVRYVRNISLCCFA